MENITLGHWIYAIIASCLYIVFVLWSFKKEMGYIKWFNFKPIPIVIWCLLILIFIIVSS